MRLIDADALPYDEFLNGTRMVMQSDIDNAPTVDAVEVVHGIDTGEDRYFHCSICGYGVADVFESNNSKVSIFEKGREWYFCPSCGAKMDGERRSDD